MELARILQELWSRKLVLVIGAGLATMIAAASIFSLTTGGLHRRSLEFATARTQVLVDFPRSSIADLQKDLGPIIVRAGVYSRFMTSPAALDVIGEEAGIPGDQIYAKGPFELNQPRIEQEPTAERRGAQLLGEMTPYKLRFESNPQIPIVTIFAQAPSTRGALALANGAAKGLDRYIKNLQQSQDIPDSNAVEIRQLGEPIGGMVNSGVDRKFAFFVFIAVFVLWCILMLLYVRFITAWRAANPQVAAQLPDEGDASAEPADDLERRLERVS